MNFLSNALSQACVDMTRGGLVAKARIKIEQHEAVRRNVSKLDMARMSVQFLETVGAVVFDDDKKITRVRSNSWLNKKLEEFSGGPAIWPVPANQAYWHLVRYGKGATVLELLDFVFPESIKSAMTEREIYLKTDGIRRQFQPDKLPIKSMWIQKVGNRFYPTRIDFAVA